jgi:hypothetical protein
MLTSGNASDGDKNGVVQINYYQLGEVEKDKLVGSMQAAATSLSKQGLKGTKDAHELA